MIPQGLLDPFKNFISNYMTAKVTYADEPAAATAPKAATQPTAAPIKAGNLAQQNFNPGNLVYMGQQGAVKGSPKGGGGFWAKFPDEKTGFQALQNDIQAKVKRNPNMTVSDLIDVRSPGSENDSKTLHYNVMDGLKDLKDSGKISTLMANKLPVSSVPMDRLAQALARAEGYYSSPQDPVAKSQ